MEHPDVIREIDALIDSYNWPSLIRAPAAAAADIKYSLRIGKDEADLRGSQQARLVMFQLLFQILQHPGVRHKAWILSALASVSGPFIDGFADADRTRIKAHHTLRYAVPVLRHYMKHHTPSARLDAAFILYNIVYQPNQIVEWFLEFLSFEHSSQVIIQIYDILGRILSYKHGMFIHPETRSRVISDLENRLKTRNALMRIAAATLMIEIMQTRTPVYVTDTIIECFFSLDSHKEAHWNILTELLLRTFMLGKRREQAFCLALLRNAGEFITALEMWGEIEGDYFSSHEGIRKIAFTIDQKKVLEALLACKPLWRKRQTPLPRWQHRKPYRFQPEHRGLEPTRAALRQQLQHARIIDETEQASEFSSEINLISYSTIPQ
jgi:hypothetical protein